MLNYGYRNAAANTSSAISPFYFDKIYTSRAQMDADCATDGVYLGRFVLVKYGKDEEFQINLNNNNFSESLGTTWINNFWMDALEYWHLDTQGGNPNINVLGYDNTVWQKNLVNGEMKYVMVSSLYSPEIDMTANLLNGELIGSQGVNIDLSWPGKNGTPSIADPGYHYTYTFKAAIDTNTGLKFSDNTDQATIQVNIKDNGGIAVDRDGISIDLADSNSGLKIETGSNGGLKADVGPSLTIGSNGIENNTPSIKTIKTDSGDVVATTIQDTATLKGGTHITTSASGKIITINSDGEPNTKIKVGNSVVVPDNNNIIILEGEETSGVQVSQSGNTIKFKYKEVIDDKATPLTLGTDYQIVAYNNFYNQSIKVNSDENDKQHYYVLNDKIIRPNGNTDSFSLKVLDKTNKGTNTSGLIYIYFESTTLFNTCFYKYPDGSPSEAKIKEAMEKGFKFKHGDIFDNTKRTGTGYKHTGTNDTNRTPVSYNYYSSQSVILGIYFIGNWKWLNNPFSGNWKYSGKAQTNLWNVGPSSARASWNITTSLIGNTTGIHPQNQYVNNNGEDTNSYRYWKKSTDQCVSIPMLTTAGWGAGQYPIDLDDISNVEHNYSVVDFDDYPATTGQKLRCPLYLIGTSYADGFNDQFTMYDSVIGGKNDTLYGNTLNSNGTYTGYFSYNP